MHRGARSHFVRFTTGIAAALVVSGSTTMLLVSPVRAEEQTDDARVSFERGQELEEGGDLAGALDEYQRAEQLRPTYRLHRHIGRVLRGLGRYREALQRFERFLQEGGDSVTEEQRQWIDSTRTEIQRLVARLEVTAPEGAEVLLDGASVGLAPLAEPLAIDPGHHVVEIRLAGHRDVRRELDITSGEVRTLEILLSSFEAEQGVTQAPSTEPDNDPEPSDHDGGVLPEDSTTASLDIPSHVDTPPSRRRIHRAVFYSLLGVSLSALGGGVVFGALTAAEHGEFERMNTPQRSDIENASLLEARRRGEAFALSADLLIFSGVALVVASLVVGLFTDFDRSERERRPQRSARSAWGKGGLW